MTQHEFFHDDLDKYSSSLIKELEDLAANLEAENYSQESELLRAAADMQSQIMDFNEQVTAAIEQDIKQSLDLE